MTPDEIKRIYANAPVGESMMEVITLSAPWFTTDYHMQNVFPEGVTVVFESGEEIETIYAPMSVEQSSSNLDLVHERSISLQMVNDIIASENDNYDPEVHDKLKPLFNARGYIVYINGEVSSLKSGPVELPVRTITTNDQGALIKVSTEPVNNSATGEVSTITRVPMLRGFV